MCTMLPMRSVPHRVICLLGVDDATFPRHRLADGDDILAGTPGSATAIHAARTASYSWTP